MAEPFFSNRKQISAKGAHILLLRILIRTNHSIFTKTLSIWKKINLMVKAKFKKMANTDTSSRMKMVQMATFCFVCNACMLGCCS